VTGDEAMAAEARDLLGDVECAVVKWGVGRNRARCLPPDKAHAEITRAVSAAVKRAASMKPYTPDLPATMRLTFYRSDMADDRARTAGVTRVDARTIEYTIDSLDRIRL